MTYPSPPILFSPRFLSSPFPLSPPPLSWVCPCPTAGEEPAGLKGYFGMTVVVKQTTTAGQGLGQGLGLGEGAGTGVRIGPVLGPGVESVRVLDASDWSHILAIWSRSTHVRLVPPRLPLSLAALTKNPLPFGGASTVRVASATKAYTR